jgi:hypothetical protein
VLARERALVLAHQRRRLSAIARIFAARRRAHVEDRPHVQRADRRVRVPGARVPWRRNTSVSRAV